MAIKTSFFTAKMVNGIPDRRYSATEVNNRFGRYFSNGIAIQGGGTLSNQLRVTGIPNTMQSQVDLGIMTIGGSDFEIYGTPEIVTHETADPTNPRIDRIVVEYNITDAVRDNVLKVITGTPAASPVAPALISSDTVKQLCLAERLIPANVSAIPVENITDTRSNPALCGVSNVMVGVTPPSGDAVLTEQVDRAPAIASEVGGTALAIELTVPIWPMPIPRYASVKFTPAEKAINPTVSINGAPAVPVDGNLKAGKPVTIIYEDGHFFVDGGGLGVNDKGQITAKAALPISAGQPVFECMQSLDAQAFQGNVGGVSIGALVYADDCIQKIDGINYLFYIGESQSGSNKWHYLMVQKQNPSTGLWSYVTNASIGNFSGNQLTLVVKRHNGSVMCAVHNQNVGQLWVFRFNGTQLTQSYTNASFYSKVCLESLNGTLYMMSVRRGSGSTESTYVSLVRSADYGVTWTGIKTWSMGVDVYYINVGCAIGIVGGEIHVLTIFTNTPYEITYGKIVANAYMELDADNSWGVEAHANESNICNGEIVIVSQSGISMVRSNNGAIERGRTSTCKEYFISKIHIRLIDHGGDLYLIMYDNPGSGSYPSFDYKPKIAKFNELFEAVPVAIYTKPLVYATSTSGGYPIGIAKLDDRVISVCTTFYGSGSSATRLNSFQFLAWDIQQMVAPIDISVSEFDDIGGLSNSTYGIALTDGSTGDEVEVMKI